MVVDSLDRGSRTKTGRCGVVGGREATGFSCEYPFELDTRFAVGIFSESPTSAKQQNEL